MKTTWSYLLVTLALLASLKLPFATLHAQGTAFTYQGRLNVDGTPVNGLYDFQFRAFNAPANGTFFGGAVTVPAVAVSNGLFTVSLAFNSAAFDGSARWLEIGVTTNGGGLFSTLTPRQPVTATPYAIVAGNVTGAIPLAQLPASVVTNGASGVNITGTFSGNGAGVSNLNLTLNSSDSIRPPAGDFFVKSTPSVGNTPYMVVAADVNGDGKPDLISANGGDNTLTVLTNNGSGNFTLASSLAVSNSPFSVVAADVNGDGKMDLISANAGASTLTVLTNKGNGVFAVASSPAVGVSPYWITSADVNGDGKPDLITANYIDFNLTVLTNNGSGGFVLASSPGVGNTPYMVVAADVNGDGKPDLISANSGNNTLTVLTNKSNGVFVLASTLGVGGNPRSVTAADVNADGKPDLICGNEYPNNGNLNANTLSVLTNNGSGGFVLSSTLSVGTGPQAVVAADVNGDGKVDLISANATDATLTVLTNNGSGGFVLSSTPSVPLGAISATAVDVNGDGRPDLISVGANKLSVLFNAIEFDGVFNGVFNGAFVGAGQFSTASFGSASFGSASFGASLSQKLNLYGTSYGIGIQNSVLYSRGTAFAWYSGGVHNDNVLNAGGGSTLMTLTSGGLVVNGTFVSASDRNLKQDFSAVNSCSILEKVAQLPIQTWTYKNDPSTKHLGPMAQDFYAAFAVGPDDKHITTVDESGVALAAIQGLNQKLNEKDAEVQALKQSVADLKKLVQAMAEKK